MKRLIVFILIALLGLVGICTAQQVTQGEREVWAEQNSVDPGTKFVSRYVKGEFMVGSQGMTITRIEILNDSRCTPNVWITHDVKGYEQNFRNFMPAKKIEGFRITQPGRYWIRPAIDRHSALGGCPKSTVIVYYTE